MHAICQNCKIVLVEAKDNSFANLEAAVDRAHTEGGIISNSYGSYGFDGSNGRSTRTTTSRTTRSSCQPATAATARPIRPA